VYVVSYVREHVSRPTLLMMMAIAPLRQHFKRGSAQTSCTDGTRPPAPAMRALSLRLLRTATPCSRARPHLPAFYPTHRALRLSSTSAPSNPPTPPPTPPAKEGERKWSTPLAQFLGQAITTTGPISVAAYMRQCLTSELGGYYTRTPTAGEDQFGTKGDFVTSPEISQVFGELIGIWLYAEWLAQGRKEKVQIIEVGPGRGTLMDDVLRTLASFKRMTSCIEAIYLVEASPHLQKQQALRLAGTEELEKSEVGWRAKCKYFPDCDIQWCEDIRFVPKGMLTIFIIMMLADTDF
jgi:NADH dehydrogenase [ubiquinone] 1 alpha subcomplex assembly factor 7